MKLVHLIHILESWARLHTLHFNFLLFRSTLRWRKKKWKWTHYAYMHSRCYACNDTITFVARTNAMNGKLSMWTMYGRLTSCDAWFGYWHILRADINGHHFRPKCTHLRDSSALQHTSVAMSKQCECNSTCFCPNRWNYCVFTHHETQKSLSWNIENANEDTSFKFTSQGETSFIRSWLQNPIVCIWMTTAFLANQISVNLPAFRGAVLDDLTFSRPRLALQKAVSCLFMPSGYKKVLWCSWLRRLLVVK